MLEYISPYYEIKIGPYLVQKAKRIDVFSDYQSPIDRAEMALDAQGVKTGAIIKGMPVEIREGYREKGLWNVFTGTVADVSWQRAVTIYARNQMEALKDTKITKTFVDVTPAEIIKYCLAKAGVAAFKLTAKALPKRHAFVVHEIDIIGVIRLISQTWQLDGWTYYFEPEGEFFWGTWEESPRYQQKEVVVFEYGKNIIDLKPSDQETGQLQTVILPFLRHSHVIRIRDQRFWQKEVPAKIEGVNHHQGEKARTWLEWRIIPS
ncbi:MAG: hypothetical protein M1379_00955 [Firmicutes bacterium]|nr:hypothetical protein [Bacillota bacterium]